MFKYCKRLSKNTKKGQSLIAQSKNNIGYELSDIYKTYSLAKKQAYWQCRRLCEREGGTSFRIISKNCNCFSVAWNVFYNGIRITRIETAYNSYAVM